MCRYNLLGEHRTGGVWQSEARLLECTGNHSENLTMSVSSVDVFVHGQKDIGLIGPVAELGQETADLQLGFWQSR
ncbi:hypothetical protein [Acinetobacter sp. ANC 5502]